MSDYVTQEEIKNSYAELEDLEKERQAKSELVNNSNLTEIEKSDIEIANRIARRLGIKYSEEQLDILKYRGNACILACAGSGKTSIITSLITKRILSGEIKYTNKMLCTTYSKKGAQEMNDRIKTVLTSMGIKDTIEVRTIHAFCYSIINRFFPGLYNVIKEGTKYKFLREACGKASFKPKDDDLILIDSLLSYQVNYLLTDSSTMSSPACRIQDLELSQYTIIRSTYAKLKREARLLDFDDMQMIMWSWLVKQKNNDVLGYCKSLYDYFFIDEAQDMSRIQYEIIRSLITKIDKPDELEKELILVGDDDQSIYSWRGADPTIILDICPEFDIRKFILSTNYRCKSEIVDIAAVGIKNNIKRSEKTMKAFEEGGRVRLIKSNHLDLYDMSIKALEYIKELESQGVDYNDIAVLSRNNFHLAMLSNMCYRNGIYCNVSQDMRLTTNIMYKDIRAIIGLVDDPWNTNNIKQVVWKMCRYIGISGTNKLVEYQSKQSLSFSMLLEYLLSNHPAFNVTYSLKDNFPLIVKENMKAFFNNLAMDTVNDLNNIYLAMTSNDKVSSIIYMLNMYVDATSQFIYKDKDKNRTVNGLVKYFSNILKEWGLDRTLNFLRMSEQLEGGAMAIPGSKVTLSTMHSAKGREWEHVIIFADDNVSMPNFSFINKMICDGVSVHDINNYIDEDRRLHYVAVTRAKSDLAIITSENMSIYLLESLGLVSNEKYGSNSDIIKMAQDGYIYTDLYKVIQGKVFGVTNRYYTKADGESENAEEKEKKCS